MPFIRTANSTLLQEEQSRSSEPQRNNHPEPLVPLPQILCPIEVMNRPRQVPASVEGQEGTFPSSYAGAAFLPALQLPKPSIQILQNITQRSRKVEAHAATKCNAAHEQQKDFIAKHQKFRLYLTLLPLHTHSLLDKVSSLLNSHPLKVSYVQSYLSCTTSFLNIQIFFSTVYGKRSHNWSLQRHGKIC